MSRPTIQELEKLNACYPSDTEFAASARLLQSKWRQSKNYPQGKLGNYLEPVFARSNKSNFLTDNIRKLVTSAVANSRNEGAVISEPRIWDNLLSSQPLCFNLFGEFYYDLNLATRFFKKLFPERIDSITSIKFEYSAGRGNIEYTGDHSAFDVFVEYLRNGKRGFIGIEVKYAESLKEESQEKAKETFKRHTSEYNRLTTDKHFKPNAVEFVSKTPLSQIWRDHLLSIAHLKDYDEGFFVFLFPGANVQCQEGVNNYVKYLVSGNEKETGFYPRYLDDFILKLRKIHDAEWTRELEERYLGTNNMNLEYFKLAQCLNEKFKSILLNENVHFRPSPGSISLISVSPETPELGVNCNAIKNASKEELPDCIGHYIGKIQEKKKPGRVTPEKELQAWLINSALRNNYSLPFDPEIRFITSELAIVNKDKIKVVTDILGYCEKTNQLCVIELKSDRLLKRLIDQVSNFEKVISDNQEFFTDLLSIHGFASKMGYSVNIRKIVIWKYKDVPPKKELKNAGIEEFVYKEKYTFMNIGILTRKL